MKVNGEEIEEIYLDPFEYNYKVEFKDGTIVVVGYDKLMEVNSDPISIRFAIIDEAIKGKLI